MKSSIPMCHGIQISKSSWLNLQVSMPKKTSMFHQVAAAAFTAAARTWHFFMVFTMRKLGFNPSTPESKHEDLTILDIL